MTEFYIKTDKAVSGPFTGVEVREAALAHVVLPATAIGPSPQGPWTRASETGLFSDKNVPLPHPSGTHLPEFRLTGVSEAFQGPFKLRELIGFAVHRMLPSDALIQVDRQGAWVPVNRIGILNACFQGEIVPPAKRQETHAGRGSRVDSPHHADDRWKGKKTVRPVRQAVAALKNEPVDEAADAEVRQVEPAPVTQTEVEPPEEQPAVEDADDSDEPQDLSLSEYNQQWRTSLRKGSKLRLPKIRAKYIGLVVVPMAVALIWALWEPSSMAREELIGDWVDASAGVESSFGISFKEDGTCVVFHTHGRSWSGDFQWIDTKQDDSGFQSLEPMSAKITDIEKNHQRGHVRPTDGYIKLKGSFSRELPEIGTKEIRECYVRREGEELKIGYLANIKWDRSKKTTEVGWMTLKPAVSHPGPISAPQNHDDLSTATLLARYGLPDEARPMHRFELPENVSPESIGDYQLVRYGNQKFIVNPNGHLQQFVPSQPKFDQTQQESL